MLDSCMFSSWVNLLLLVRKTKGMKIKTDNYLINYFLKVYKRKSLVSDKAFKILKIKFFFNRIYKVELFPWE